MENREQMVEEQAEQDFAKAFAEESEAEAPDDNTSAFTGEDNLKDDGHEDDPEDAPKLAPDQEETEESAVELSMEKKAHGYDSMLGRLEKERAEKKRLQEELKNLRAAQVEKDSAPADPIQKKEVFDVPDELKSELLDVEREDPELAVLFSEDSTDGRRLRSVLQDYGKDVALIQAGAVATARELKEQNQAITQTVSQSAEQAHVAAICAAVDGYEDLITNPSRKEEKEAYHRELREYVEAQPYNIAAEKLAVIERGTPTQVASLLNEFNATRGSLQADRAKADADAALAVPSKPSPLPKSKGDKNDFDAGWDED